ncbi:uncharacterized protein LOC123566435 [Mercenaria mercenaria]|uniref:uncharacterized protein LOC123566435 n=1 Tax=Mercenaria mercenaria TaxID=6596 RepID=UPI00234E4C62|nr:uncharacterized protein LOC123566435 [Mercenaria mercenaria]
MGKQDGANELGCDLDGGNIDPAYTQRNEQETSDESMSSANNDGNIDECPTNIDGGYIHAVWTQEFDTGKREGKFENSDMDSPLETSAANFKGAMVETTPKGIAPEQDMDVEQKDPEKNVEFANRTCQENIVTTCEQDFETEEHGGKLEEMTVEEIIPTRDCK